MLTLHIYGFGSYFSTNDPYNDIDILIIHNDSTRESCSFAIDCKTSLTKRIPLAHITMLTQEEDINTNFSIAANVTKIGSLLRDKTNFEASIDRIAALIEKVRNQD